VAVVGIVFVFADMGNVGVVSGPFFMGGALVLVFLGGRRLFRERPRRGEWKGSG